MDHSALATKLWLRRWGLARWHADGRAHVLDCCAGEQRLWTTLRQTAAIAGYLAIDRKPSVRGSHVRIADSVRLLSAPGLAARFDVVDIDTYGEPWKHYAALAAWPTLRQGRTIFLTHGRSPMNHSKCASLVARVLGCVTLARAIPQSIAPRLYTEARAALLALASGPDRTVEAWEAPCSPGALAQYYVVRIEPRVGHAPHETNGAPAGSTADAPATTDTSEVSHGR